MQMCFVSAFIQRSLRIRNLSIGEGGEGGPVDGYWG